MSTKSSYDKNRIEIFKIMQEHNIHNGSTSHQKLRTFLLDPDNSCYLQSYFIICSGYLDQEIATQKLKDLVAEMEFVNNGNYSYRSLFNIDPEWGDFFKENAYPHPSGQRKLHLGDYRRGVDKEYVDFIMEIKKDSPDLNLEQAIIKACHARYPKDLI